MSPITLTCFHTSELGFKVHDMESLMVPCTIIVIISYIKHQNNNLSKFSRNTTLLFYHNKYYVSSTDCTRDFYYFVLKTIITLLFPTNNVTFTTTQL